MNHVRIHGDPFADTAESSQLRSFLRFAMGSGMRCSLSLSAVPARHPGPEERSIPLTDGVRNWSTATSLPPAEVDLVMRSAAECVFATAPVVVFGRSDQRQDAIRQLGLEWPRATVVMAAMPGVTAPELLSRVVGELRWAGEENPPHALTEAELRPWLALPAAGSGGVFVHVADDLFAAGSDLVVDAFVRQFADSGMRLRLVLPSATDGMLTVLRERAGAAAHLVEVIGDAFAPEHVLDAVAIVMPMRRFADGRLLVQAMASGRPVCVARFAANAAMLEGRAIVHAIGGGHIVDHAEHGTFFAPHPRAIVVAMLAAAEEASPSSTGGRARAHVIAECTRGRPASPPPALANLGEDRPVVVLEAPIFETSSSAELTIATAQALLRRGNVDLKIVPSTPFRHGLSWLRQRAPDLEAHLTRAPGRADYWLSAGWPVRASRPDCRTWALRVDWEYGALPLALTPHVTEDADQVVVHSEHVYRTIMAAGRSMSSIKVVPHGADAVMHADALPSQRILQFKAGRPAVLFCGGMVWRKGFDVFLQAVLAARAAGHDFVVVVKGVGADQHYGRFHLRALLDRFEKTSGTPPVLRLDQDMSRDQMASMYTACDVMLHPYRGEGFGMPVLEARACGLPVIATRGGATDQLMDGPGVRKIDAERRPVDLPGAHTSAPWVLEPSADSAIEQFCAVLEDLPAQLLAARRVAVAVQEAFSWDAAAMAIEELVGQGVGRRRVETLSGRPVVLMPAIRSGELDPHLEPVRS